MPQVRSPKRTWSLLLLTGDVRVGELSRTGDGPSLLDDFTSSALARYSTGSTGWEDCVRPHRVPGAFSRGNFGLVETARDAKPSPVITLWLVTVEGSVAMQQELQLDALRPSQ